MKTTYVDILKMELEDKLPYWLDPRERYKPVLDATRKKFRDAAKAKQEQSTSGK